jgi:hypothetical protein
MHSAFAKESSIFKCAFIKTADHTIILSTEVGTREARKRTPR